MGGRSYDQAQKDWGPGTVHTLSGYSAHADQAGLVDWVMSMGEVPKEIRLVHGEVNARKILAKALGIKNIKY